MKILSNTAMSLDGRISPVDATHMPIGSPEDRRRMSLLRAQADAVLVGGNTFRLWPIPLVPRPEDRHRDYVSDPLLNVIVSRRMDFKLPERFLQERAVQPLFLTDQPGDWTRFPAEVISTPAITPQWIVEVLAGRGVKTLLIEGGGRLIAEFVEADLLDELYVTVCPLLIGGDTTPRLMNGSGFRYDNLVHLELVSQDVVAPEIFLHYRVRKR